MSALTPGQFSLSCGSETLWGWIIHLIPVLLNISPQVVLWMRLMPLEISAAGTVQRIKHAMLKYFELKAIKKRSGLPSSFWKAHNIIILYKDKGALSPLSARKDAGQSLQTTSDPYHSGNSTRGIYTSLIYWPSHNLLPPMTQSPFTLSWHFYKHLLSLLKMLYKRKVWAVSLRFPHSLCISHVYMKYTC